MRRFRRLFETLIHLKVKQILYQIRYRLTKATRKTKLKGGVFRPRELESWPKKSRSVKKIGNRCVFTFIGREKHFQSKQIDWNFRGHGLLWAYNLNYFDWLHQAGVTSEVSLDLLKTFYNSVDQNPIALHPYPTSLRIINVSKFVCKWDIRETWLHQQVVADLHLLKSRLEYHLLANHLLENAFALYVGGLVTGEHDILNAGRQLLEQQLEEQILNDGMHYERSPMYHMLILDRLLDALNFAKAYEDELVESFKWFARKMTSLALNWSELERIPMMQDSAYGIAPQLPDILRYAERLLVEDMPLVPGKLCQSRYRTLTSRALTLIANVGSIHPSYQPGHAHADELHFELYQKGKPVITDIGVSTYEKNERRLLERSTASHNCISWGGNSSDVWSGFRVGQRANVKLLQDTESTIVAEHDGHPQAHVRRRYESVYDDGLAITDTIRPKKALQEPGIGKLHLHPGLKAVISNEHEVLLSNNLRITFKSANSSSPEIRLGEYKCAQGYNTLATGVVISYSVADEINILFRNVT